MNLEEEKMRVIIDYFSDNFPVPYCIQTKSVTRTQRTIHDDWTLRVLRDGKVAFTVVVSSALLSHASPSPTKLGELLEGESITDKLRHSAQFRLNHYELGTGEAAEYG